MYKYQNILLPVDFTEGSETATEHAIELAKSMGAKIHLVTVLQSVVYPTGIEIAHESLINLEKELEKNAEKNLKEISDRLLSLGIENESHILMGKPSEQICEYAKKDNIDIVVIATHGSSGLEHFLFGSTTEKVIRGVRIPVLVVHFKESK